MKKEAIVLFIFVLLSFIVSGCQSKEIRESPNITINNSNATLNETSANITLNDSEELNTSLNETANETSNETELSCLDTDGGLEYSKKGTVIASNGKYRQVKDFCESSAKLVEYYCNDDLTVGVSIYECFSGGEYTCSDGACGVSSSNTSNTTNITG